MSKNLYIIGLLYLLVTQISARESTAISREEWEKSVSKHDYTETYKEPKEREKAPKEYKQKARKTREVKSPGFVKSLPIILLAVLLVVLIIMLVNSTSGIRMARRMAGGHSIEELDDPDKFELSELEQYLREAIDTGNYRLAIRINFLMIMKALQEKEIIQWRKEKTNQDYLRELTLVELHPPFRGVIRVFERVWYANYGIDKQLYALLSKQFTDLLTRIEN